MKFFQNDQTQSEIFYLVLMVILSLAIVFLSGCEREYKNYYWADSKNKAPFDQCKSMVTNNCGVLLWNCTSGREYSCLTNVQVRE